MKHDIHHHTRSTCRLCNSADITPVMELASTPLANELLNTQAASLTQDIFPLRLFFCEQCKHVQLVDVVSPTRLFEAYLYVSGTSESFRNHFKQYAGQVVSDYDFQKDDLIVEIGSNDGTLLKCFKTHGLRIIGVDPAKNIAASATEDGVETIAAFFSRAIADDIIEQHGQAKAVIANNVLAHIDDLASVVQASHHLLSQDGLLIGEVSYLGDVIDKGLFDTIYHEHLDYHSIGPLQRFLESKNFELIDVIHVDTHGGSVRFVAQKRGASRSIRPSVNDFLSMEAQKGLYTKQIFTAFGKHITTMGEKLLKHLKSAKQRGEKVAGFGLPAKATTLMHQFGIDKDLIQYIVDDNPMKQGKFSPGLGIPIQASSKLTQDPPDQILILAWNFANPIKDRLSQYIDKDVKVITPLPEFDVTNLS